MSRKVKLPNLKRDGSPRRGGRRPGAGRKKGSGTVKGAKAEARQKAALEGILPVEYMLRVMRDARVPKARRDSMAIAAAPYLHSKLSSVEVKNKKGEKFKLATENMTPKEAMDAYMSTLSQPTFEDDEDPTTH